MHWSVPFPSNLKTPFTKPALTLRFSSARHGKRCALVLPLPLPYFEGMGFLSLILFGFGTATLWGYPTQRWRHWVGGTFFMLGGFFGGTGLVIALVLNLKGLFI